MMDAHSRSERVDVYDATSNCQIERCQNTGAAVAKKYDAAGTGAVAVAARSTVGGAENFGVSSQLEITSSISFANLRV